MKISIPQHTKYLLIFVAGVVVGIITLQTFNIKPTETTFLKQAVNLAPNITKINTLILSTVSLNVPHEGEGKTIMLVFEDLSCPYSARFYTQIYPKIREKYVNTKKLSVYFKDFPLIVLHGRNPYYVAGFLKCVYDADPDLYFKLKDIIYRERRYWVVMNKTELDNYLRNLLNMYADNVEYGDIMQCYYSNQTYERVNADMHEGKMLGVLGTPTSILLIPKEYLTPSEIVEIEQYLETLYRQPVIIYEYKDYYVLHIIGAIPFIYFDYVLSRATS